MNHELFVCITCIIGIQRKTNRCKIKEEYITETIKALL